jgi:hypothetical protein
VIKALASDGADDPLRVGVLPRRVWRGADLLDAHAIRGGRERSKRVVAIVHEVVWGRVLRKGLPELLCGPEGGRMCGHRDVDDAATVMGKDDQDE